MSLRVVGAGFPRTGTMSLKAALERLLGGSCYHTSELFRHVDHGPVWRAALRGELPDWDTLLSDFVAGVDWPVAWFWRELAAAYPDAVVVLSRRSSAESWHASMEGTVLKERRRVLRGDGWGAAGTSQSDEQRPGWAANATFEQAQAVGDVFQLMNGTAFPDPDDRAAVIEMYDRHLAEVRFAIPGTRLVEWEPGAGWEPLCGALGVPVPDEPFPHENSTVAYEVRGRRLAARPSANPDLPPSPGKSPLP